MTAPKSTLRAKLLLLLASSLVALLMLEIGTRIYAAPIYREWDELMLEPRHYLQKSDNPVLGYEHVPNKTVLFKDRRLSINAHGIRADSDDLFPDRLRIGLLGDSVTFGVRTTQEETLAARLQRSLRDDGVDAAVVNLGTGGYGMNELSEFFPLKDAIYDFDLCIYIFNPNDFARRDSVYEGGDNGVYRMYHRPTWTAPWYLVRTLRSQLMADGNPLSWYRFIYRGNRDNGFDRLDAMVHYARDHDIGFAVALMPSGFAYERGDYLLQREYEEIQAFLSERGVPNYFPRQQFAPSSNRLIDETDHLNRAGDRAMTRVLVGVVQDLMAEVAAVHR